METCSGLSVTKFGGRGDGGFDNSEAFARAVAALAECRYGTVYVPDGVFGVSRPVLIPHHVSLSLAPSAKILALPGFEGEAVVIKGAEKPETVDATWHDYGGQICGGIIDAGRQEIVGLKVPWGRRYAIRDLEVHNARAGGIHLGQYGWYEATLHSVRISLDFDCPHCPDSIGLSVERVSDTHVSQVLVIGYPTGVYASASSTMFNQIHVWNGPNRPLKRAYHCAGWNDTYMQCQADAYDATAFYVDAPYQRFIGNFCQTHDRFSTPEHLIGFEISDRGTHCTYLGNFHNAREQTPIQEAFAGSLEGATVLGNLQTPHVTGGQQNCIPSATGGRSWIPPFGFQGGQIGLGEGVPSPPAADEGRPGEIRWGLVDGEPTLFLRTGAGWSRARLEDV